jgi:hypothetical protein
VGNNGWGADLRSNEAPPEGIRNLLARSFGQNARGLPGGADRRCNLFSVCAWLASELLSPDGWKLYQFYMKRPDAQEVQLDLVLSYRTNVAL